MDLRTGKLITIPKVVGIPIKYVLINSIEKMAEDQEFKSLKIYNRKKKEIIPPDVDLAVVDHQQQIEQIKENEDTEY